MQSDAGDLGWGAHSEDGPEGGWQQHGELPVDTLDESSTVREITGLMLAAQGQAEALRGKQVCIRMDSYPAIRNLINGGGPVERINSLVREWWLWCREHAIKPRYEWVPREENTRADELSKRAARSHNLRPEAEKNIREWLVEQGEPGMHRVQWLRTNIRVPEFDTVRQRLEEMIRARRPGCIVVPVWGGQVWWNTLKRYSSARLRIGTARRTLASYEGPHDPSMEAHLVVPELRGNGTLEKAIHSECDGRSIRQQHRETGWPQGSDNATGGREG
jgi:ribonuclease HI